jgi:hypothetical protein
MTNPFPEPKPIDWGDLEEGDRVLLEGIVKLTKDEGAVSLQLSEGGCWAPAIFQMHSAVGHVIKAPKPIAVGDKVQTIGLVGFWCILAINDHLAWIKGCTPKNEGIYEIAPVDGLKRIET